MSTVISYLNLIDTATVNVFDNGDNVPGVPGSGANLQNPNRNSKWVGPVVPVSGGANGIAYEWDDSVDLSVVALLDHDAVLTNPADFVLQNRNAALSWSNLADSLGVVWEDDEAARHGVWYLPTPLESTGIRMLWNTNASTGETISASRLWAGPAIDLSGSVTTHTENTELIDPSTQSYGRQLTRDGRTRQLKRTVTELGDIPTATAWGDETDSVNCLDSMGAAVGRSGDVLLIPDTTTAANRRRGFVYGTLTQDLKLQGLRPRRATIAIREL
ncbi:MAG: hypothetical protein AAF358_13780 [Pseudomonadota bacterium]